MAEELGIHGLDVVEKNSEPVGREITCELHDVGVRRLLGSYAATIPEPLTESELPTTHEDVSASSWHPAPANLTEKEIGGLASRFSKGA